MTSASGSRPGLLRRHALKLAASAAITIGILYTARSGGLKLVPDGGDFTSVRYWGLVAYAPLVLVMMWFRSVRWRFLLRSIIAVPKRRLFAITGAGYMAILLLPFRIGELVRPYLLRTRPEERRDGSPTVTMTAATSSVVAERVIDGVVLSLILLLALLLAPTADPLPKRVFGLPVSMAHVRYAAFMMPVVFAAALAMILVFYFARDWADRVTRAVLGKLSVRLANKIADTAAKLADGLHVFRSGRDMLGFLVETAIYWACNAVSMWLLAISCGIVHGDGTAITFPEACALMGMLGCAVLIPGPPGLLGVFQAGIYAGMTMYFPREIVSGSGAAYVFLLYVAQLVLTVGVGIWGLWYVGGARRLRGALDAPQLVEAEVASDAERGDSPPLRVA